MRRLTYLAILRPSVDGYRIHFPDLPGCTSSGIDIDEAQRKAKEALESHIYGMEKENKQLPVPVHVLNPDDIDGCVVVAVSILPDIVKNEIDNRRVKTNTTIPSWLKELGEANGINFSKLLEVALLDSLGLNQLNANQ